MKTYKIVFLISFTLFSFVALSQNCVNYHSEECRWADDSFLYSRQSKSAMFTPGMSSEFVITVYDEEYYISIKGEKVLGKIRIRVREDNPEKTVLYDNSKFKYEDFFYFKNENTRNLIIEVSSEAKKKFSSSADRHCLGVLIEFRNENNTKGDTGF
ncbi:MAG: hypothetical protein JEY96_04725 [Bacteroidales bacterium]|nr:hypothetical protein [Bacteroidales bacterium]